MGNRAVIQIKDSELGIYLHWNGGVESVLAFLEAAKQLDVRDPINDDAYCLARLTQIIGNFFGGTTSLGIGLAKYLDNSDNGTYVIGKDFEIVRRINGANKILRVDQLKDKPLSGHEGRQYYEGVLAEVLAKNKQIFSEG